MADDQPARASDATARTHVVVAAVYLAAALWAYRVVLPSPGGTLPLPQAGPGSHRTATMSGDLRQVIGVVTNDARTLVSRPRRLLDGIQCYPMPFGATLTEHMIGEGLLAAPTYLATGDPFVAYNVTLVAILWLGALSMYALALYWTGSAPAALVAGFLASFHPVRIANPAHPYVSANLWTPLALLFAHRLFATGRWQAAVGLAGAVCLQLLESVYQVLAFAVLGAVYGLSLLARHARVAGRRLPQLLLAALAVLALAAAVFGPYLRVRDAFPVLTGRVPLLLQPRDFLYGGAAYVGTICLVLAVLGLLDRLRGARPRAGSDPRVPLLIGAALLFWASVAFVWLPGVGPVPSLTTLAAAVVPGLDAIRATFLVAWGVHLVAAFLAAYGVLLVTARARASLRWALAAVCVAAAALEAFDPARSARAFGTSSALVAEPLRPRPAVEALLERIEPGAVLDLPFTFDPLVALGTLPGYVLQSAFHHQPVAACYASFNSPVQHDVVELAQRLPEPLAADALYALGFRTLIVHRDVMWPGVGEAIVEVLRTAERTRAEHVGETDEGTRPVVVRLVSDTSIEPSFQALRPAPIAPIEVEPPSAEVEFAFGVQGTKTYRHPDPIWPTRLLVRWYEGAVVKAEARATLLLPLAIAVGDRATRTLSLDVPLPPGAYIVTLSPATDPERIVGQRYVHVVPPASGSSSGADADGGDAQGASTR